MADQNQNAPIKNEQQPAFSFPVVSHDASAASDSRGVRLGSLWISYEDSYHEAWQKLLPPTPQLAYPILYLQRHTFELLVKEILSALLAIREELHTLDELFGTLRGTGPVDSLDIDAANSTHSFSAIFPRLERNLATTGFPRLPQAFNEARKLFDGVDDDHPDRLRFATVFSKRQRTRQPSFPHEFDEAKAKFAPCDGVGKLLSQIMSARKRQLDYSVNCGQSTETSELDTFYERYWDECRASEFEIANGLGALEAATRTGETVWREVASTGLRIEDHPDLKSIEKALADRCLETTFRERVLVVLIFRDVVTSRGSGGTRTDDGFFLAAKRPNGTLTPGVWPEHSQSNLIYEIGQAFKRKAEAST